MKVILLSDLHIVPDGKDSWGINPLLRLRAAVDGIIAYHADAEICVILGDIANKGETAAYQLAAKELARLPMPFYLLAGNHDKRENMRGVFREQPEGFMQQIVCASDGDFILLDRVKDGSADGEFCAVRAEWLKQTLAVTARPVFICMHHPSVELGLPEDEIMLNDTGELIAAIDTAPEKIRHFIFGHTHATVNGVWRGIPFAALRSLVQQGFFTIGSEPAEFTRTPPRTTAFLSPMKNKLSYTITAFWKTPPPAAMMIDYWNGLYDYSYLSPLCLSHPLMCRPSGSWCVQ
ncbi:MAG: metallophosphoesterase [Candidatus Zeuxoniibacter abyssi]|nr:MAG: metallophosphoesterase [Candidatus Persebacteraceae bacterium AB1(2)]